MINKRMKLQFENYMKVKRLMRAWYINSLKNTILAQKLTLYTCMLLT